MPKRKSTLFRWSVRQRVDKLSVAGASALLDAQTNVHNLNCVALGRPSLNGEYFTRFLSLLGWKKNHRRDHRHYSNSFCNRTSAGQPADFYRTGLDQRLLATSPRSRPAAFAGSSIFPRRSRSFPLLHAPARDGESPRPARAVSRPAICEGDVRISSHGHERSDRAGVYHLPSCAFHRASNRPSLWLAQG